MCSTNSADHGRPPERTDDDEGTTTSPETVRRVDAAKVIDFAVRWHPYGGGPAIEIMASFGMARHRLWLIGQLRAGST